MFVNSIHGSKYAFKFILGSALAATTAALSQRLTKNNIFLKLKKRKNGTCKKYAVISCGFHYKLICFYRDVNLFGYASKTKTQKKNAVWRKVWFSQ